MYLSILPPNAVLYEDWGVCFMNTEFQVCSLALSLEHFFLIQCNMLFWKIKTNTPANKAMCIDGWFLSCLHYAFRIIAKGSRCSEKYLKTTTKAKVPYDNRRITFVLMLTAIFFINKYIRISLSLL